MILTESTLVVRGEVGSRAAGPGADGIGIAGSGASGVGMAGFVSWLAGQRVPLQQRTRVYREVEAFLAWQHTEFPGVVEQPRPAVWCYLLRRQRDGASEAAVLKVWGALELLLTYLETS